MSSVLHYAGLMLIALSGCHFDPSGSSPGNVDANLAVIDADLTAPDAAPNAADASLLVADAQVGQPDASNNNPDAGPGEVGVECGVMSCSASQECCSTSQDKMCVAAGTCQGFSEACDGPEDCTNQICCSGLSGATCKASCGQTEGEVCAIDSDCSQGGDLCCKFELFNNPVSMCLSQCPGGSP